MIHQRQGRPREDLLRCRPTSRRRRPAAKPAGASAAKTLGRRLSSVMSYDLHLFSPQAGVDLLACAVTSHEEAAEDVADGPLDTAAEDRKRRLVVALRRAVPHLEPFLFDYAEIAKLEGISEDMARRRFRHVELNGPDDGGGVQVTLFDQHASITVPYWHTGERAVGVFREIWTCLATLEREAGLRTYDPQLEQVVRLEDDFDRVLCQYAHGVAFTQGSTQPIRREKPWWKFW